MRHPHVPLSLLLFSGTLQACVVGGDKVPRPRDLPSSSLVDRTRILAIRANPPEIGPDQTATFEILLADPDQSVQNKIWIACPPDRASDFGCAVDPSVLTDEDATFQDLEEAGVIGFEPLFAPEYTADASLLDDLDEMDAREGVYVTIQVIALPDVEADTATFDFNEIESAHKRLVVSNALTPNRNPGLEHVVVDGYEFPEGSVFEVDPEQSYTIGVQLSDDAVEDYLYVTSEGIEEVRTEEPYINWYATDGTVLEPNTLYPYLESSWRAPEEADATGTIYGVIRDRRGGISWIEVPWRVRPPSE